MQKFNVPVMYQMYGHVTVNAENVEQAIEIVESDESIGLPFNAEYVEGSWEVDYDMVYVTN